MNSTIGDFSIQRWLETCPQAYLQGTVYGHELGATESPEILNNPILREDAIRTTVQLVVGERAALAASSGLINAAPDEESKCFLATQTLDEARHVEIFCNRLYRLGVKKSELETVIENYANPHLISFAEILLEKVDKKDFVAGVVGQNLILEGMAFTVFEMLEAMQNTINPSFSQVLRGTIADERRHVGFGENRIGRLISKYPNRRRDVERMQGEMSFQMLATFSDVFSTAHQAMEQARLIMVAKGEESPSQWQGADLAAISPDDLQMVLTQTVLNEFKTRLDRVGIQFQEPRFV